MALSALKAGALFASILIFSPVRGLRACTADICSIFFLLPYKSYFPYSCSHFRASCVPVIPGNSREFFAHSISHIQAVYEVQIIALTDKNVRCKRPAEGKEKHQGNCTGTQGKQLYDHVQSSSDRPRTELQGNRTHVLYALPTGQRAFHLMVGVLPYGSRRHAPATLESYYRAKVSRDLGY